MDGSAGGHQAPTPLHQGGGQQQVIGIAVSPFALLRIAALPYRLLTQAALQDTWRHILAWRAAECEIRHIAPLAVDVMHQLMPGTADKARRRMLLSLKRAAHNCGEIKFTTEVLAFHAQLCAAGPASEHSACERWLSAHLARQRAQRAAQQALRQEIDQRTRVALQSALADPAFSYALSLSAPRLFQKLTLYQDWHFGKATTNKSERSLMNYVGRAAAKTSPLSTFMFNAWVTHDAQAAHSDVQLPRTLRYHNNTSLTRGVVARIARYARKDWHKHPCAIVSPNRSLTINDEGASQALAHAHVELLGRAWRQERVANFSLPLTVRTALSHFTHSMRWQELLGHCQASGMSEEEASRCIKQLLSRGLIHPQALWSGQIGEPLTALLASLQAEALDDPSQAAHLAELCATLQQLQKAVSEIDQATSRTSVGLHSRIDSLVMQAQDQVGARFVKPFHSNLSQNACLSGVQGGFGAGLDSLVKELGATLAEHVCVAHEYRLLLDLFCEHYGEGGQCDDLLAFVMQHSTQFEQRCRQLSSGASALATTRSVSNALLGVTAYVQLLAPDLAAVDAGRARLVANLLYERAGWQAARYLPAAGHDDAQAVQMLTRWLQQIAGPRETVEISISADCNGLQAHQAVTKRVLAWPGEGVESFAAEAALDPRQVRIKHDVADNLLHFYDQHDQPLQLFYLGAVMPLPSWGLSYMLVKMTEPLCILRPVHLLQTPNLDDSADVHHQARLEQGRIVLFRAMWRVRAQALLRLLEMGDTVQQMYQLSEFFAEHAIARITYVNAIIESSAVDAQRQNTDRLRKPTWFDLANPLCLDLLKRLCQSSTWICLREALPNEQDMWLEIADERHVSELQLELTLQMGQL